MPEMYCVIQLHDQEWFISFCSIGHDITKYTFTRIFRDAWNETMKPSTIINSYKGSGINPVNRDAVKEDKIMPIEDIEVSRRAVLRIPGTNITFCD